MSVLLTAVAVFSFSACGDSPEVEIEEIVPAIAFTDVGAGGIMLNDIGETKTVTVALTPSDLPNIDKFHYVLTSENEKIFTVTQAGVVTAVGQGQAMLRATAPNNTGVTASCKVTVKGELVTSITIDPLGKEITLTRDGTYPTFNLGQYVTVGPLTATTPVVRYVSSNENIVKIDENGLVKAFGYGTATIRVEAADGSGVYDEAVAKISSYEYFLLDRSNWAMTSSPTTTFVPTGTTDEYGGPIANLIDDNSQDTRVGLLKELAPGGPSDGILYFTIDLGDSPPTFNYFRWEGGWTNGTNGNNNSKINRINYLYGSNDSVDGPWETLQTNITISGSVYDQTITLTGAGGTPPPYNYRYVRVEVRPSQAAITGNVVAVLWRDFKLGNRQLFGPED